MNSTHPGLRRISRAAISLTGAIALIAAVPVVAHADPPPALPQNADGMEQTYSPAYDYDTDGCYPTPAIGSNGVIAPGLALGGHMNGQCRDQWDLDNTNGYARYKCNNGWCAIMYGLYFEKDQASLGPGSAGHRHDWEHVVVWVQNGTAQYVSTSQHGNYAIHHRNNIRWDGTHPKVVYHKDGPGTHCFRAANGNDEPPENHYRGWQFPRLVGWNGYPAGLRDKLVNANFGSASFALKDGNFNGQLEKAKPSSLPFNPHA